jgi:hypothetical protein
MLADRRGWMEQDETTSKKCGPLLIFTVYINNKKILLFHHLSPQWQSNGSIRHCLDQLFHRSGKFISDIQLHLIIDSAHYN